MLVFARDVTITDCTILLGAFKKVNVGNQVIQSL